MKIENQLMTKKVIPGTCGANGDNLTWSLDTGSGVLTISGSGAMADYYDVGGAPWYSHRSKIKTVMIGNGVTSIGEQAFSGCGLTSITLPNSVTSIGGGAFYSCGLTGITIPNSVTSIGSSAFFGCRGLTSITIPNSVTSIGKSAFGSCSGLTGFAVSEGNARYAATDGVLFSKDRDTLIAYPNAKAATYYVIPDSVTSIKSWAFAGSTRLTCVTIPYDVTIIGEYAFSGCSSLTSVTLGKNVTSIGQSAFFGCISLMEIHSKNPEPPSVVTDAFSGVATEKCIL